MTSRVWFSPPNPFCVARKREREERERERERETPRNFRWFHVRALVCKKINVADHRHLCKKIEYMFFMTLTHLHFSSRHPSSSELQKRRPAGFYRNIYIFFHSIFLNHENPVYAKLDFIPGQVVFYLLMNRTTTKHLALQ